MNNEFVSVPREWLKGLLDHADDEFEHIGTDLQVVVDSVKALLAQPAEVTGNDVLRWMDEHAAAQHQGEPVAWVYMRNGKINYDADIVISNSNGDTIGDGDSWVPVFTHADAGEVERLRAALKFYADREHYHFESGNWDTVSGEPLNILWCGDEPDFIEDGSVARAALSASAEPSAPKCCVCGQGAWACNEGGCHYLESGNGEPSAPVEHPFQAAMREHGVEIGLRATVAQQAELIAHYRAQLAELNKAPVERDERDGV